MRRGTIVEVIMNWKQPPSATYQVKVDRVENNILYGVYRYMWDEAPNPEWTKGTGGFPLQQILEFKVIGSTYKDGDTFKGVHYEYERINGAWYIKTSFTDDTISNVKDPQKEPLAKKPVTLQKIVRTVDHEQPEFKIRASGGMITTDHGPQAINKNTHKDGDWCGR